MRTALAQGLSEVEFEARLRDQAQTRLS
jgi:hypothetical protein